MKRCVAVAATAALVLAAGSAPAVAKPVPSFTSAQVASLSVAFDASASVCHIAPCGYNWKYFGPTTNRLGVQMGDLPKVSYSFPAIGFYTVVLTVSEKCTPRGYSWCPATDSRGITVGY